MDILTASDDEILSSYSPTETPVETSTEEAPLEQTSEVNSTELTDEEISEESSDSINEDGEKVEENLVEEDKTVDTEVDDAKSQLDLLFAPITANGKDIQIDNIEDARRLIQMGLGFNKKMAKLKPHLKIVKMLENNDLLSEEKLSFLIDISKKDPKAIGKLLADSELDPLNLTPGNDYTPNTYSVSDSELELNNTLDSLQDSKHYGQLLDIVVNKWDGASKELLVSNPNIINGIHEHIASGIYAQVTTIMEKERALGRLNGLCDLAAYKAVGDMMDAKGLFNLQKDKTTEAAPVITKAKGVTESELKSRKLAASPTKSAPVKQSKLADFNPLSASDEDIANMTLDKFI
jgi:hypothetical protein